MEKFVVGIFAILCLHIGFVLYVGDYGTGSSARLGARNDVFDQTPLFNFPNRGISKPTQKEDTIMIARGGTEETVFGGNSPAESFDRSAELTELTYQPNERPLRPIEVVYRKRNIDAIPRSARAIRGMNEPVYQNASYIVTRSVVPPGKSLVAPPILMEDKSGLMASSKKNKRGDKRSLLSKMSPIVKKPYDWLKAVGSWVR